MLLGSRLGVPRTVKRRVHRLEDAVHVKRQIAVPKANDAVTLRFQPIRAKLISYSVRLDIVLSAAKLDHQTSGQAGKVDDIRSNRYLSAKMRSICFDRAKALP